MKVKTIIGIIIVLIVGYASKTIIQKEMHSSSNGAHKTVTRQADDTSQEIASILAATANEINKNTPLQLDKYTVLDNVASTGHFFIYNYTITDDTLVSQFSKNKNIIRSNLINNFCTSQDMQILRDYQIDVIYRYKDTDYKEIGNFKINRDDCHDKKETSTRSINQS